MRFHRITVLIAVGACLLPASASAENAFLETFGSAAQPSFLKPQALAVDQASGDLYVADIGINEVQSVTVSATAGEFKLCFKGDCTEPSLPHNAPATGGGSVETALRALPSIGSSGVLVAGGPGDGAGSKPYIVTFIGPLGTTDVEALICENGTTPLSGGSGCSVATTTPGVASKVRRFNPDGTPHDFSALAGSVLDNLVFNFDPSNQIAIDSSGGITDGDIYVTQPGKRLVNVFGEDGSLLGQITESSEGPFAETCGVAVDESGALYIDDFNFSDAIHKYVPSANPPVKTDNPSNFTSLAGPGFVCNLVAGAGPTAGFLFVGKTNGKLFKLDSANGELDYEITTDVTKVAVDPATGHVYAAKGSEVVEYDASGGTEATEVSSFSPGSTVEGLAVDGVTGNVYVARQGSTQVEVWGPIVVPEALTEAADSVGTESATLNGTVNPNGLPLTACFFEWGETAGYGEVAPCEPDFEAVGEGNTPVPVHADLSGLKAGTPYHFRLVAENSKGSAEGDDEAFTTLGPAIANSTASQITATAAKISAEVNPNGEETGFFVQYVTEAKFLEDGYAQATSVPASPKAVGSGSEFEEVAQQLSGLAPGTTYHFRIVAANPAATAQGPDGKFATFAQAPPVLPDGRAYEMVSPPQKAGEVLPPSPFQSIGGSCPIGAECLPGINPPSAPMQSAPDGEAVVYEGQPFSGGLAAGVNEYLSGRAVGGWGTEALSSPLFVEGEDQGFKAVSTDLSRAIVYEIEPALSAEAPVGEEGKSFANLYLLEEGAMEPLVGEEPPQRSPGRVGDRFEVVYGGANSGSALTEGFGHVLFAANDALTEASAFAPEAPEIEGDQFCRVGENCNLYEWEEGELRLVNVLPDNETAAPGSVFGSRLANDEPPAVDQAISADGSRIFWSDENGQVFVRIDGEETREIDAPGTPSRFLTASTDGARVLLGDGCLYEIEAEACADLTAGEGGFQGILGTAEDLSRIYFVDTAVLSGSEENANEEQAEAGKFNLYLWAEGATSFIGTLLAADDPAMIGVWKPSSSRRTAQVSPDGRFLAFMSQAQLTGYDNNLTGGGQCVRHSATSACNEVFHYDAEAAQLSCVSCNPSGQRPIGESNLSLIEEVVAIPAAPFPAPHNLTTEGEGRLFFESQDALSTRDNNDGVQDVYEWEPNGVGSCERPEGCVYLISSGQAENDSMFVNSSANGDDAFFITRERLLPRDKDEKLDLYDARAPHTPGEAVGFPESEIAPCAGEACKGPISSPLPQPSAASSFLAGPGNLTQRKPPRCAKGKVRRRGRCVARRKARQQHRRRAGHNRRTPR